jgi:hypothetical protein
VHPADGSGPARPRARTRARSRSDVIEDPVGFPPGVHAVDRLPGGKSADSGSGIPYGPRRLQWWVSQRRMNRVYFIREASGKLIGRESGTAARRALHCRECIIIVEVTGENGLLREIQLQKFRKL